jgi:integrase
MRRVRPWYRRDRSRYYATMSGQQVPLSPAPCPESPENYQIALSVLQRLLASPQSHDLPSPAVSVLAAGWLALVDRRAKDGQLDTYTAKNYRAIVRHLVADFGSRPAASVSPAELERWADRPAWSASYQSLILYTCGRVLKEAGLRLTITRPASESRGADVVLSDEQFAAVLKEAREHPPAADFIALLKLLRSTGARPGEAARLTAELVDWPEACARLVRHKTRRKTGRPRLLVFNSAAMAVLEGQRVRYPSGALFRNRFGRPFTSHSITRRCEQIGEALGVRVLAYGLGRHSFATAALINGCSDSEVAALLGHTGTRMLHAHYNHLTENARALRAAAEKAGGKVG